MHRKMGLRKLSLANMVHSLAMAVEKVKGNYTFRLAQNHCTNE